MESQDSYIEYENEEDSWIQVYNIPESINPYIENIEHLQILRDGIYYQTFGGGPEGGFVVLENGDIYEITRNWFKPFSYEKIGQKKISFMTEYDCLFMKLD
jgi:hypothetical protein